MSLDTASVVLELSGMEKVCCIHGGWITICHAAHLTGDHTIIVNNIQHVIPHLLKRHPRMRTRLHIEGYHHSLQFFDYNKKQLCAHLFYSIINTNDQSWEKIAEDECNRNPYSDNGKIIFPLFHFKLILNENISLSNNNLFHLLLFSQHCASDGRSGYILLNDFLTLVTSSDLYEKNEPVNTQVIPCISQLIPPRPYGPFYWLMSWINKQIGRHELRELRQPRIPVKPVRLYSEPTPFYHQPMKNNFLFTSSSSTLYSRLHDKCRSQQLTLNGPLLGCLLLAVHHCFPSRKKKNRSLISFVTGIAVDMRSRLPQSPLTPQTVGACNSSCDIKLNRQFPLATTPFWTLAKKCMRATNKAIASGDTNSVAHFLDYITSNERKFAQFSRFFPNGITSELFFSNNGKYPFPCDYNQGQLRLRGLHFINNCSLYYSTANFYVTCAGDEQLDFSLSHVMESKEKASEFLDSYVRLIEACADADIGITLDQLLASINS
jgi:hypothetical protein